MTIFVACILWAVTDAAKSQFYDAGVMALWAVIFGGYAVGHLQGTSGMRLREAMRRCGLVVDTPLDMATHAAFALLVTVVIWAAIMTTKHISQYHPHRG